MLRTEQRCHIVLSGSWHKRGKGVSGEEGPWGPKVIPFGVKEIFEQ